MTQQHPGHTDETHTHPDRERGFEIGTDEAWKAALQMIFANIKRSYDEYQQESLETIRIQRTAVQKILSDAQQYDNQRQTIANQALQNAVETANMVGKQNVRHSDIALDRQWNVDEQGHTVQDILQNETFQQAITAAVAGAVNEALAAVGAVPRADTP